MWDVFAVSTYFTVSVLFWYMGLIPDLAVMRDRAKTQIRKFAYGLFSLGWTGSNRHWSNYEKAYLILAGLSTPLVLSVHSIVSLDFSVSQLPGWHTTIFPPYFVAGAVFSGFGMVLTLLIPLRKLFKLEDIITMRHVDLMCKVTLATGSIVGYAYAMEFFIAWYSGNPNERFHFMQPRVWVRMQWGYWIMIVCNVHRAAVFLVQESAPEPGGRVHHVDFREHRHVVRTVRHHRDRRCTAISFRPTGDIISPTWVDILHISRNVRIVLHVLPVVPAFPADDRDRGSQRRDAASRSASSAGRRESEEVITE